MLRFACANTDTCALYDNPAVSTCPLTASTPATDAARLTDAGPCAGVIIHVNAWLAPPANVTQPAGACAEIVAPTASVVIALGLTKFAALVPRFCTVSTTVTALPVPIDVGATVRLLIANAAGFSITTLLLVAGPNTLTFPVFASFALTLPCNVIVPVPNAR
jgi:hypothetical protein